MLWTLWETSYFYRVNVSRVGSKKKKSRLDVEKFFLRETEVADEDEYESEEVHSLLLHSNL